MAMFDDPKKELKKLEEQLLKEEEWLERELAAARELIGDQPVKKVKKTVENKEDAPVRGSEETRKKAEKVVVPASGDYDLDKKKAKKKKKKKAGKSNRGLVILAILETLGIVGIIAYWMIMIL